MSLFEDILNSDKLQLFIKNNPSFSPIYNTLKKKKQQNKDNLTPEEQLDEDARFSNIAKKESALMSYSDKVALIKTILKLDDNFPNKDIKYQELEFFSSNSYDTKDKNDTFFDKINRTQTTIGKYQLMKTLINPIDNINLLNERKKALHILENFTDKITKNKTNQLNNILNDIKSIKDCEEDILWFFKTPSPEMKNMLHMIYFNSFWNKWINQQDKLLTVFYYCKLIIIPLYGLLIPLFLIIIPYLFIKKLMKIKIPFKTYWKIIRKVYLGGGGLSSTLKHFFNVYGNMKDESSTTSKQFHSLSGMIVKLVKMLIDSNITKYAYYLFTIGSYIYGLYSTLNYSYSYLKIINLFQTKLHNVSKFIRKIQIIHSSIGCLDSSELKEKFENKLDFYKNSSLNLLNDNVFKNKPSYIFSNKGLILKQFLILKENPDILKDYLLYLGEIDALTSNLVLKRDLNMITADYQVQEKPFINVEGFYNLMIPKDKSVKNDIIIGNSICEVEDKDNQAIKSNIMITGPNASGKSTFLKALTETLIMAQTICVVPATKLVLTPFKHINTYLNIPDCQGKESLFQAEMSRCYQQIESFKNMKSNEFVFSIMDEIFVSTNYNEGLSGAYAVARKMASFDNSICIISTHFSKLSNYCGDEENCYKNYHFSIDYNKDNKIIKTYKLQEGTSKQHIALEMLEEKGFDNDLINDAKKMYNELVNTKEDTKEDTKKPKLTKKKPIK